MPTPNSPIAHNDDIHSDPAFADQFGGHPGDMAQDTTLGERYVPQPRSLRRLSCNVGRTGQKIRVAAGAALVTAAAVAPVNRNWRLAMAVFGVAQLVTGSLRHCPVWQAVGVNTCEKFER